MKKLFLFASLPTAFLLTFSTALTVSAQTQSASSKVSITPVTFNLTSNAGDTLKEVIKVRNDAAITQVLSIQAQNFLAVGEEGQVGLTQDNTTYSLAKWINFDQSSYTLKSGEEVQVPFTIRVPFNAEPGGHYASVYAQISPNKPGETSGSTIGQKIGALILLRVAGDIKESASVDSFSAKQDKPQDPVEFDIRIKNNGSVHIRPQGFVTITDIFGKKVKDAKVDDQNVFPGAIRHMSATWKDHPFIGRFTANMLMYYGQNNQQLTASTTFWIIPWTQLAIIAGILIVVLVILWFGRRRIGKSLAALVGK